MKLPVVAGIVALTVGIVGCGSGGQNTGFQFSPSPQGDVSHWADVWCGLNGSMTRDDVIAAMGQPTQEFDASQGTPQSQWDAGDFHYTAFYGSDGRLNQAYVNPLEIEQAGIPNPFPCPLVRFF